MEQTETFPRTGVLSFLNRFRLHWNRQHVATVQPDSAGNTHVCLLNSVIPGWYMLAIQVATTHIKQDGSVVLTDVKGESTSYGLAFHGSRVVKRLIRVTSVCKFQVDLGARMAPADVLDFSMKRVTPGFARSRMLTKLHALHPLYKARSAKQRRLRLPDQDNNVKIDGLWQDYCNLFDNTPHIAPYKLWVEQFDTLSHKDCLTLAATIDTFSTLPIVSVLMPVYNPNVEWLGQAIDSVRNQIYPHWQLCIADDASTNPRVKEILDQYAEMDSRIMVVHRPENGHISACSNSALALASGEWLALLDHDDVLTVDALLRVVAVIQHHPDVRLLYSDEDKIDENGNRSDPYFKCEWNHDLFYSQNMISHLGVYHMALVRKVGGFRLGFEGSQDYDLALRCIEHIAPKQIHHIARVLYHWRIHADSTANGPGAKPYAALAGERALNDHFARMDIAAHASAVPAGYRVRYPRPSTPPLVSIIIPTHNALTLLRQCVTSILNLTTYPHYEIILVDNRTDDREALSYLKHIATHPRVRVVRDPQDFNYSAINNRAVMHARGEILAFLNNDVEVINSDWLDEMVNHAIRPGIGAVGAKLLYPDDTVQHAGIILGVHGIAGHAHRFLPRDAVGYCGRAALIQSFSAVTGACLLVKRALFEMVGGFNEIDLAVAGNDVDFCLCLSSAGYRTLWTPYALLYHHESASRGFDDTPEKQARSDRENAYLRQQWQNVIEHDTAYSPNLSLEDEAFSVAWPPRTSIKNNGTSHARY